LRTPAPDVHDILCGGPGDRERDRERDRETQRESDRERDRENMRRRRSHGIIPGIPGTVP
jgi:hypothetical protein